LAIVGISLSHHKQLDETLSQIANLDNVNWAAAVTGRYDIFVEIVLDEHMDSLYHFLTVKLPSLGGILSSESFMVMKARRKWVLLPEGLTRWGNRRKEQEDSVKKLAD
jgi:Lrp/AsnC family transcriptional regulator for asnA, asnC and gidA